jgi:hypothetical protein
LKRLIKPKEAVLILIVLAVLTVIILLGNNSKGAAEITVITETGAQVYSIDLRADRRFVLEDLTGTRIPDMEFEVSGGDIRVTKSDCPGGDCVHQGFASHTGGVIVCVPNRVTVRLTDTENEYDAVV